LGGSGSEVAALGVGSAERQLELRHDPHRSRLPPDDAMNETFLAYLAEDTACPQVTSGTADRNDWGSGRTKGGDAVLATPTAAPSGRKRSPTTSVSSGSVFRAASVPVNVVQGGTLALSDSCHPEDKRTVRPRYAPESVDHLWTKNVATPATCAAQGIVSIRCFRRSAPTRRPGGQGVAGSNPVSPTGRDRPLNWTNIQVNGLFLVPQLILIDSPQWTRRTPKPA
jgi:hypothetical protein